MCSGEFEWRGPRDTPATAIQDARGNLIAGKQARLGHYFHEMYNDDTANYDVALPIFLSFELSLSLSSFSFEKICTLLNIPPCTRYKIYWNE